jgi:Uma2 family endonuclease
MPEVEARPHLFTVEEYMASNVPGHTELIGGVIYDVSPANPPHANAVVFLHEHLTLNLDRTTYQVRQTQPLAIAGWTGREAPEPDIAVVRRREYVRHPTADDTVAVLEVSDTTYLYDRNVKIPLYEAAEIPAWIVNITERKVEFYGPKRREYRDGETFEVLGVSISVSDVLPKG